MTGALQSFWCEEVVGNINTTTSGFSPWVSNILSVAKGSLLVPRTGGGDVDAVFIDH
jgi:hypothetical protein